MELKAQSPTLMMSEALKGRLTDADADGGTADDAPPALEVTVVAMVKVGDKQTALVGLLRSVLFDDDKPELEFRVQLTDALDFVAAKSLLFQGFELHHGDNCAVAVTGPFVVKGARIDDINVAQQLCVLCLGLVRAIRTVTA